MNLCSERMYRIEVINLSGEIVYLSLDTKNQINEELLKGKLPDEAYLLRISGDNHYWFEKLLLNQDC